MRAVVQRVRSAAVTVGEAGVERELARIGRGLLVFVGVERGDVPLTPSTSPRRFATCACSRTPGHRIAIWTGPFRMSAGPCWWSRSSRWRPTAGKAAGPSFDGAAPPDTARPLYEDVVRGLETAGLDVATGEFQATMQVALVNDGPVTLLLDSRKQF